MNFVDKLSYRSATRLKILVSLFHQNSESVCKYKFYSSWIRCFRTRRAPFPGHPMACLDRLMLESKTSIPVL
jgi:hypothetical protein